MFKNSIKWLGLLILVTSCSPFSDLPEDGSVIKVEKSSRHQEIMKEMAEDWKAIEESFSYKLWMSIENRNIEELKELLRDPEADVNLSKKNYYGNRALHDAIMKNWVEGVRALLKHPKIDKNLKDSYGYPPIYYSIFHKVSPDMIALLALDPEIDFNISCKYAAPKINGKKDVMIEFTILEWYIRNSDYYGLSERAISSLARRKYSGFSKLHYLAMLLGGFRNYETLRFALALTKAHYDEINISDIYEYEHNEKSDPLHRITEFAIDEISDFQTKGSEIAYELFELLWSHPSAKPDNVETRRNKTSWETLLQARITAGDINLGIELDQVKFINDEEGLLEEMKKLERLRKAAKIIAMKKREQLFKAALKNFPVDDYGYFESGRSPFLIAAKTAHFYDKWSLQNGDSRDRIKALESIIGRPEPVRQEALTENGLFFAEYFYSKNERNKLFERADLDLSVVNPKSKETLLIFALSNGMHKTAMKIVESGQYDPNAKNRYGYTAAMIMMVANYSFFSELFESILLNPKIDFSLTNNTGETLLDFIVNNHHITALKSVVKHKNRIPAEIFKRAVDSVRKNIKEMEEKSRNGEYSNSYRSESLRKMLKILL